MTNEEVCKLQDAIDSAMALGKMMYDSARRMGFSDYNAMMIVISQITALMGFSRK